MQAEVFEKMLLAAGLRTALERREFSLHYQPVIDIASRRVLGFEALLRWRSAEHGAVPPARFIPLAEQNGMIHPIGAWVLREVCHFIRRLTDAGHARLATQAAAWRGLTADMTSLLHTVPGRARPSAAETTHPSITSTTRSAR